MLNLDTMTFTAGPSMIAKRAGCCAIRLDARRMLAVGGCDHLLATLDTTEVLGLDSMVFTDGPSMLAARSYAAVR